MSKQPKARLPQWIESRYESLWEKFNEKSFDLDQAHNALEKFKDKRKEIPVIISELKNAGWLKTELDPKDSRKRTYSLMSRIEIIEKVLDIESKPVGRGEIEKILKRAADLIRTRVDYKFILLLLFLKRVNDKWELEFDQAYKEAIKDGLNEKDARKEATSSAYHDYNLPEEAKWENLRKEVEILPETFSKAMKKLSETNPELRDVIDNFDFLQFASNRENAEILKQLVELFSERRLHTVSADILGDAYEWILRYFAPEKAKEGEVYTPPEINNLIAKILDPMPKDKIEDPACASCGMLLACYRHVKENKSKVEADKLFLFGQEQNPQTLALGRMNLSIHDIENAQLVQGDSLLRPKFKEGDDVKKFDILLANPPWNQDGYDEEILKRGEFWHKRFGYGFPPSQSADWAWIQHMLSSIDEKTGRVGVVIDTGSLSRSGKEETIRQQIIDKDLFECIILLPEKLFYNTPSAGCILIFKNKKRINRKEKILFINASEKFERHPDVRKLNRLNDEHVEEIVQAYKKFDDIDNFCQVVLVDKIKNNNYSLNISKYVDLTQESIDVDITKEWREIQQLEKKQENTETKLFEFLKELGYEN